MRKIFLIFLSILSVQVLIAQTVDPSYALIIKGGYVMDSKNNVDGVMDVAINTEGRLQR